MSDMATKNKTKKTNEPLTLNDRLDKIQDMLETLSSDIFAGDITMNEVTEELEEITVKIENFRDFL